VGGKETVDGKTEWIRYRNLRGSGSEGCRIAIGFDLEIFEKKCYRIENMKSGRFCNAVVSGDKNYRITRKATGLHESTG
jgi:hypothetical protein